MNKNKELHLFLVNFLKFTFFSLFITSIISFLLNKILNSYLDSWDTFYKISKTYDIIFLGSSHAQNTFNPEVIYNKFKLNSYNFGTGVQSPYQSYYTLKEVLKYTKPKIVVLETYWNVINNEERYEAYYNITQNMKFSFNKIHFVLNSKKFKLLLFKELILPNIERNLKTFFIKNKNKNIDNYYKGFAKNTNILTNLECKDPEFEKFTYSDYQLLYIAKIHDHCIKNNIKLVMITAPIYTEIITNYFQSYKKYIYEPLRNFFDKKNIIFLDYNLLSFENKYLLDYKKDFADEGHLNNFGAEKKYNLHHQFFNKYYKQ